MKRTTIKDIARQLGVAPSTVSRALKDHPDIGLALRTEIKKLAEELHYRPNQLAVHLRQRSSKLIGLIVPEITMFFYPSVIKGIQEIIQEHGYNLIMLSSHESPEKEMENIRICADNEVAGILISLSRQSEMYENLEYLRELGIPLVLFDKVSIDLPFDSIMLEDEEAARQATTFLIESGCRNPGAIFGNPNMLITQERVRGMRKAMEENGLPFKKEYMYFADNVVEAEACAKLLMAQNPPPDGVFAMTDEVLMGSLSVIAGSNTNIPANCSVICISDGVLPYCMTPTVSFLHHNGLELGQLAANRMFELLESGEFINDEYSGVKKTVQAKLIQLSSTRQLVF